jgi:hypothetical protein
MAQLKRLCDKRPHCFSNVELLPFLLISLVLLYSGVTGIIENASPENLSSVGVTMVGFFAYIQYHLLILGGALAFTFGIWLFTNKNKC